MKIFDYVTEICLLMIVIAMIVMTFLVIEISEPMKTAISVILWAFFGAKMPWTKAI